MTRKRGGNKYGSSLLLRSLAVRGSREQQSRHEGLGDMITRIPESSSSIVAAFAELDMRCINVVPAMP